MQIELSCILDFMNFFLNVARPPTMELETKDLEEKFQGLKDKKGNPITKVYANKGL